MSHPPTLEQEAILQAVKADQTNLMINAYAGCGKTTTLEMIAKAQTAVPALALAFNVKIKKELEARFPPNFTVMTMNGLGHRAWGQAIGKRLILEDKKLGKLLTECSRSMGYNLTSDEWNSARQLVSAAMNAGMVPRAFSQIKGLIEDTEAEWLALAETKWIEANEGIIAVCREVLAQNVKLAYQGQISFDDQIYMSAIFGGVFPRFPLVLVDEAQDLSPLNHLQLRKCAAGRLIVVGDPKQAIYAFRGADSASMEKIRGLRPNWTDLPLATTFRCPKKIVLRQSDHAPGFTAWPTNRDGKFDWWRDEAQPNGTPWEGWGWEQLKAESERNDYAILCRNNAPLLGMAFKLIRQKVGVQMLGRDIGKGLIALSKKLCPLDDTPAVECVRLITSWQENEISLAMANKKEEKVAGITDRAECLLAVIDGSECKDAKGLRRALDDLFGREAGLVTLSTGHRAKGLEWDCVLHLDPWRLPSKFAKRQAERGDQAQMEQEMNLRYVIETRTKHTLILANLEDFQ